TITQRTYPETTKIFGGDEAAHRNWGLRNIAFKYPWVLLLDADERVTLELKDAILETVESPGEHVAFRIQRRDFLRKRWLKHVQTSPFYLRLFRPEKMRYERVVNCLSIADGPVGSVTGFLDHYPFSKGMGHWLERHNSYSTLEARQIMENRRGRASFSFLKAFAARDFHERRFHQKELFYRLPLRPAVKFLILYVGKRGFLDGGAGLTYAILQAIYEYMIVLKVRELECES
ncbi:MAG: glycosyl transferase family 2, partial [Gammaproteobacteria bacterium]|nr:glycosyl transferase family 2 [Gammaproteobacteria bacterium]